MWLLTVCRALAVEKVKFAVAGGYAVALHGAVRGTVDIDVVVATDVVNLKALEKALTALGLLSRIPVTAREVAAFREEYIKNRDLIAWSFVDPANPAKVVDAIIAHPFRKREIVQLKVGDDKLPVLSRSALIAMKKKSGRPQDLEDARALEALNEKR